MTPKLLCFYSNRVLQIFILFLILVLFLSSFYIKNTEAKVYCSDGRVVDTPEECMGSGGSGTSTGISGGSSGIDLTLDDVVNIIQKVAGYFYSIAIALAVIITTYVGILFFTAGGDDQQVGKAKKIMIWLIVGIAILLIGRGIITLVENILTMAG